MPFLTALNHNHTSMTIWETKKKKTLHVGRGYAAVLWQQKEQAPHEKVKKGKRMEVYGTRIGA